ncbi:MAG: 6-pyruvoyl-tetrahydropterin synthase-related protein [Chloroflexota bacterium]
MKALSHTISHSLQWLSQRVDLAAVAALFMAMPLIVPFLRSGIPITADAENHLHRIPSVIVSLQNGYLWPRWTPYLHQGYGYPLHNFHPPGTYIVDALIYFATHMNIVSIFTLSQIIMTLLYPLGAYLFARTFTGRAGALIAAAAYTYAPFRFIELWVQSDLPQFAAMALFPWLLWAIARGAQQRRLIWLVVTGLCLMAIIFSHHATTFFVAPFAMAYGLLMTWIQYREHGREVMLRAFATTVGGLAFGVALSSVYWLPALTEISYIQIHTIQDAMFGVEANFLPLNRLLAGTVPIDRALFNWTYAYAAGGPRVGQPQLIAALIGLLALLPMVRCRYVLKVHVIVGALTLALCLFLITPASLWVWSMIPLARLLQYPWRLLGVVAVAVLPGAAVIPELIPQRWRSAVAGAVIGIFFVAELPFLYAPLHFEEVPPPTPATAMAHEKQTGLIGLTSSNEYLPRWVTTRPAAGFKDPKTRDEQNAVAQTFQWRVWIDDNNLPEGTTITYNPTSAPGSSRYTVQTPTTFTLDFHQMYFPGWLVTIDGQEAALGQSSPNGLITTPLSAGTHDVTITYAGTATQHLADLISIIATFAGVVMLMIIVVRRRTIPKAINPPVAEPMNGLALRVIAVIVVFVVINQAVIVPYTTLFRPTSDPEALPVQFKAHEVFGDSLELLGYDLETPEVRPGQKVSLYLYWRLLKPTDQALRAAIHLTSVGGRDSWGKVESFNLGSMNTTLWPTGSYVVDHYALTVDSTAPPYLGELRLSVFPLDSALAYLKTSQGAEAFVLANVRVTGNLNIVADSQIIPLKASFGNGAVTLLGYSKRPSEDGRKCILLRWQVHKPFDSNTVLLHVLDANGNAIANGDGPPLDDLYPTDQWRPDQILDDTHCYDVPDGAATLAIGLYSPVSGVRLAALSDSGEMLKDNIIDIPLTK